MKRIALLLGMSAAVIGSTTCAQAQNYPWCAAYNMGYGGTQNCGFVSYEQCMATVTGIGGFCERNTQYVPGTGSAPPQSRRKARHPS